MSQTASAAASTGRSRPTALGRVEAIFIAPKGAAPMQRVERIEALAGRGLAGDRYGAAAGTFSDAQREAHLVDADAQVTLIEAEAVEAAAREYEIPLDPSETRRNILTRGAALNHLVGREFAIGDEVVLRGIKLCEPCGHLEKLTRAGVRKSLVHRGGLRAEVVRGGSVHRGDPIADIAPVE